MIEDMERDLPPAGAAKRVELAPIFGRVSFAGGGLPLLGEGLGLLF